VRALVPGTARGEVVRLDEGLSFWGGYDPETGTIIDRSHPQRGQSLAGKIVVMPQGRGSSSASSVLAEALRLGTGPAAIVLGEPDQILVIGSLVAGLLYGVECPIYLGDPGELSEGYVELGET
jgi:predicted aconitase with swiveling domain